MNHVILKGCILLKKLRSHLCVLRIWNSTRLIFNQCLSKVRRKVNEGKKGNSNWMHQTLWSTYQKGPDPSTKSLCTCFCVLSIIFILLVMKSKYLSKYIKTHFFQEASGTHLLPHHILFLFTLIYTHKQLTSYFELRDFCFKCFLLVTNLGTGRQRFSCVCSSSKFPE